MNVKITKRILSGALAVALVMAPSVGAFAVSGNSVKSTSSAVAAPTTGTYVEAASTYKAVKSTSSVAGVKSTVSGAYMLEKGIAAAVTTPVDTIAQSYAFAAGEKPYVKVFDMDVKKSTLAKASLDLAAAAFGGTNVGYIQFELGKMVKGQYSLLAAEPGVAASFSIPKSAVTAGARFAVIQVVEGGAYKILEDTDNNPATVSITLSGGASALSIVKY